VPTHTQGASRELAITLDHLGKDYVSGGCLVRALQDCTLSISQGELFGLFGPNGAGKTTLIHVLSTLTAPTSGSATVGGYDVHTHPLQVRQQIGVLTETQRAFHGRLSGRQNLEFFASLHGMTRSQSCQRISQLLLEFGLVGAADRAVQTYSSGMLQRLHMVRVLLHDPPILLLDEPTSSMDIQTADLVRHLVRDELVGRRKKTVLYTTHDLYEMDRFCDRIGILNQGRAVAHGTVDELLDRLQLPEGLRLDIAPGADATLEALAALPAVDSVHIVCRQSARAELELIMAEATSSSLSSVWSLLSSRQEIVHRFDRPQGDGIGRLLRHYTSSGEDAPC
jgi:ABC-2 type transport system ATP-binding protein